MHDPSLTPAEQERVRNARIRRLRTEREGGLHRRAGRRFQPLVLLGWIGGVIALTVIVLYLGILALSPAIMAWVEARPTLIQNDLVVDFVNWYDPAAIADTPASSTYQRISVEIPPGATDSFIGDLLVGQGLIHSERHSTTRCTRPSARGTSTPASTTCHPRSFLVHHRRTPPGGGARGHDHHSRGACLEELIAYLGTTELTMDLDEFRTLVVTPPPDVISAYPFLAELPAGRNLEGYLYPDTYRLFANATARDVLDRLLSTFDQRVTQDIRDQLAARALNIEWAIRLASIVEREAVLDEERALIAGVYTRRLTTEGWRMDADPTLQWGLSTAEYSGLPTTEWGAVSRWRPLPAGGAEVVLPPELQAYQTYQVVGLPPTPIASPRIASIQAVAFPDMEAGTSSSSPPARTAFVTVPTGSPSPWPTTRRTSPRRRRNAPDRSSGGPTGSRTADPSVRGPRAAGSLNLDAILVQRRTTSRYLSGFALRRGDESTSGYSGSLLVTADHAWILADNRYVEQAAAEAPDWDLVQTAEPLRAPRRRPRNGRRPSPRPRRGSDDARHVAGAGGSRARCRAGPGRIEPRRARLLKSAAEIDAIGRACALGDEAFAHVCDVIRPGMSELAVARLIATFFEDHGAEDLAFDSIVLVGPRASMPHGTSGQEVVAEGEALLLDFGCQVDGYRSDMTRTVFVGEPSSEARQRHALVVQAQAAALAVIAVGAAASAPHQAARASLAEAGYPEAFSRRRPWHRPRCPRAPRLEDVQCATAGRNGVQRRARPLPSRRDRNQGSRTSSSSRMPGPAS